MQPFAAGFRSLHAHAGYVSARPGEAFGKSQADRVGADRDDRNTAVLLPERAGGLRPGGKKDVDLERNQLGCEAGQPICLAVRATKFDHEVPSLDVAEIAQALPKRLLKRMPSGADRQAAYCS